MKPKLIAFSLACAFAAGWAFYLMVLHEQAVASLLQPGLLCGPEGGCGSVLASEYSEVMGIAVSAPAVPLFTMLALLGLAAASGDTVDARRVLESAVAAGLAGLAFGGWLLFHMLVTIGHFCPYCLVMDAATLLVLGLAAWAHPEGPKAAFTNLPGLVGDLTNAGPSAAVFGAVLLGTPALATFSMGYEPVANDAPVEVVIADEPPAAAKNKGKKTKPIKGKGKGKAKSRRVVIPPNAVDIPLDRTVPTKGATNAPVSIVLFEDFQCPFCKTLSGNIEGLLAERNDVEIAFVHFPMHSACNEAGIAKDMHANACNASAASVCAQKQGKFWEMHDLLFQNNAHLKNRDLATYAAELGLDRNAFTQCMRNPATLEKIRADSRLGKQVGVSGTPTFFVNGHRLSGGQPVEVLSAVVDALKAKKAKAERVILDVDIKDEIVEEVSGPSEVRIGNFTIDAFEASIIDGAARSVPGVESARSVSWAEAGAACEAAGKRLCTEAEWLQACTGEVPRDGDGDGVFSDDRQLGRAHPYGPFQQPSWCASGRTKDEPGDLRTGVHPKCVTPDGVYDLEGLTKEWVGTVPSNAAVKGGSYFSGRSARCGYFKDSIAPDTRDDSIGFRCCRGGDVDVADQYPGGKVGDTIQDWTGKTTTGGSLGMAQLRGKPFIMTFWASWCGPCRKELPALAQFYEDNKDKGLVVVGINVDRDPGAARRFLKQNPLPFPVVLDTDNSLMGRFDTRGVPTTFWVTPSGTIRQRTTGYAESEQRHFEGYVADLIAATD